MIHSFRNREDAYFGCHERAPANRGRKKAMKQLRIFALFAAIGAATSTSALADLYVRLGSVDVGFRTDRDTTWTRIGGVMEGLRLVADRSVIRFRSIVADFGDGTLQNVFSGQLLD